MSNGYVNGDGLVYGYKYNITTWDVCQGRWALTIFDNRFLSSWFEGELCILMLAIAAAFIVKMLDIDSVSGNLLISMLIATQTHFAQWQGSPYILFPYSSAFCFSVISAYAMWCGIKNKKNLYNALGIIFMAISLGVYQAYLPVTVGLIYMKMMEHVIKGEKVKEFFKKCISFIVTLAITGIVYYICLKIWMYKYHAIATEGRGWAELLKGDLAIFAEPIVTIKNMYKLFMELTIKNGVINFNWEHKLVYFLFGIVLSIVIFVWAVCEKHKVHCFILILMVITFPVVIMMLMMMTDTIIPWSMFPGIILVPIMYFS